MKHAFLSALLLLLAALSLLVACGHNGSTPSKDTTDEEVQSGTLVTESGESVTDDRLYGWFEQGGALIHRDLYECVGTRDSMDIAMAKNEYEGFQYILLSNRNYDDLRCEVSDLTDGRGNTLTGVVHVVYNVNVRKSDNLHPRGYTPEILMPQDDPYQGGTFDVVAKRAKTLYVQYRTDVNTVPGTYTGTLEIKQGDTVLHTHDIGVKVWDVYYEEATECITMYCCGYVSGDWGCGGPGPEGAPDMDVALYGDLAWQRRQQYYDYLLEHRMAPIVVPLPGELLNEDFDTVKKYMDNPRFNAVQLNEYDRLEEQIAVAKENGWYDKLLFSLGDEPDSPEQIADFKRRAAALTERTGITRFNSCFGMIGGPGEAWMAPTDGPNVIELMSEYTTFYTINAVDVFNGPLKNSLLKLKRERGDTVLWYSCDTQGGKPQYVNMLTCTPATEKRILFWQQYQNDIDGYLGFQTTRWNTYVDPWLPDYEDRVWKPVSTIVGGTGDGVMVYWHPETKAPVGTLTLEGNRDGIEDFQLLRMAEALLGKDVAMAYAERITTSNTVYTKDADLLAQVRLALGNAVEAAMAR